MHIVQAVVDALNVFECIHNSKYFYQTLSSQHLLRSLLSALVAYLFNLPQRLLALLARWRHPTSLSSSTEHLCFTRVLLFSQHVTRCLCDVQRDPASHVVSIQLLHIRSKTG